MSPPSSTTAAAGLLLKNRIVAAIRGAIVADAATMGLHWIYDPSELQTRITSSGRTLSEPEFLTPPQPNFYSAQEFRGHYQAGMSSPYGELLTHTLQHVASVGPTHLSGQTTSKALYTWAKSFGGRPDGALKKFIETYDQHKDATDYVCCGADDDQQAMIYAKVVPVTCLFAGQPELPQKLEDVIRAHQNSDNAVRFGLAASRLLEAVLLGAPLDQALATCYENSQDASIQEAYDWAKAAAASGDSLEQSLLKLSHEMLKDQPDSPMYNFTARSCNTPQAFMGPLALFFRPEMTFASAVRENILAAGDNCSRSIFIGSIYGALEGREATEEWFGKCFHIVQDACVASAKQISTLRTGIE